MWGVTRDICLGYARVFQGGMRSNWHHALQLCRIVATIERSMAKDKTYSTKLK
jgi:hypothetical protein